MSDADEGAPKLWRHRDFLKLWVGQSISVFGSQFTGIALPIVALQLGATAFQFGILNAVETLPFLLFGLFVGVWVDRWPRRPVLIIGDVGRGLLVTLIALLFLAGILQLVHIFVVGFVIGVLTVFFDVAYQSYLPSLVETTQLVDANGKLETTRAAAQVAGPGLGGVIILFLSAAFAMILDGLSFFVSGAFLLAIRRKEVPPEKKRMAVDPSARHRRWKRFRQSWASMAADLREGLGTVFGDKRLRGIAGCTATSNFFNSVLGSVLVLFMAVDLGYAPSILAGVLGLVFSLGSVGALVGAVAAGRTAKRLGVGNAIVAGAVIFCLSEGFVALAVQPYAIPMLIAGTFLTLFGALIYNVNQVSLRQAITPNRLQGRMNATMRFLVWGTLPLGAITGGILGTFIGLRATLLFAVAGGSTSVFWLLASPVPTLRTIPSAAK